MTNYNSIYIDDKIIKKAEKRVKRRIKNCIKRKLSLIQPYLVKHRSGKYSNTTLDGYADALKFVLECDALK